MKYYCIAQRGRGNDWVQRWEMRVDGLLSTLTRVQKDTMIAVLTKTRTEEGKAIRRQFKNDIGVPFQGVKAYAPRKDGLCNTITTFSNDNLIMTDTMTDNKGEYKENPTKSDLLKYFSNRIAIRKMTPIEAFRLMDVNNRDIEKIRAYPWTNYAEREKALNGKDDKERRRMLRQGISKTAQFKLAGNSIVVSCLYYIFKNLFIPKDAYGNRT